jgi:ammonium transporter Rh
MIFVGFGFLMTVMRKFSYSALCFTFLIGAISFQLHPLFTMLFETAYHKAHYHIAMSIELLILASFCAGSILIAFGGIIGKVTPFQLVVMVFLQTIVYTLNENICLYMGVADIGGSMVIHEFGAFFGLTVSFLITPLSAKNNPAAESSYASDVTSMIGTVFLWMYWPSFNGALADPLSERANRAFVNTILGISASCVSGFMFSSLWREDGKLKMVDIQNATLAGGVALGTIADMRIIPVVAILVGGFAGFVSTFGFAKL